MNDTPAPPCGRVQVGPASFLVRGLSTEGEISLLDQLQQGALDAMGPGGFFARVAPSLDWLRSTGRHQDATELIAETARLVIGGATASRDDALKFRATPAGVALELFARTREAHPKVTHEEFAAVITSVNAPDLHRQILAVVTGKPSAAPAAPTP